MTGDEDQMLRILRDLDPARRDLYRRQVEQGEGGIDRLALLLRVGGVFDRRPVRGDSARGDRRCRPGIDGAYVKPTLGSGPCILATTSGLGLVLTGLAVELALSVYRSRGDHTLNYLLAAVFFFVSAYFVYRSFYGMRIGSDDAAVTAAIQRMVEGPIPVRYVENTVIVSILEEVLEVCAERNRVRLRNGSRSPI